MAWTLASLDALEDAIASGARSVSYEGKSVTYGSLSEMMQVRYMMRKALGLIPSSGMYIAAHDRAYGGSEEENPE